MIELESFLKKAIEMKASDIHITVGLPPKVRLNGALVNLEGYGKMLPDDTREFVTSLMSEKQLEIFNQKGEVDFAFSINTIGRFRVNAFKQRGSVACALRVVNTRIPSPEELGIPQSVVDLYSRKRGLVLVTGPTGSGKSTTLASIIDKINKERNDHVITLEDPIEYLHQHNHAMVNQREVGLDTGSYGAALRAALREDPDVILVGEMRDLETISTALTAAETGHLVFSTLHTIGAASTIDRIVDVFPPHQQQQVRVQLSMVLEAVISQQLMPLADKNGRIAAFEVMHANPAIRNLIREGKTHQVQTILQTNKRSGMQTMDDCIIEHFFQGDIDAKTAIDYAQDITYVSQKVKMY